MGKIYKECDLCGKIVDVWHEVQTETHKSDIFNYVKGFEYIEIEDICLECKKNIKNAVKITVENILNLNGEEE